MRKIMLLAAMLAMVLAAAAPALGQGETGDVAGDDQVNIGDETVYSAVCQNIIGAFEASAGQGATVDASAVAGGNASVAANIAQSQNVSVEQVNECLNATVTATATTAAEAQYATGTATATATALPATGGPVPSGALALGAGALLVAGGLLARRIVR